MRAIQMPMARNSAIPCPVTTIWQFPALQFVSGATFRAVTCVAMAYWVAECPAGSLDGNAYAALARMNAGQWQTVKREAMPAIAALLPVLQARFQVAQAARASVAKSRRKNGMNGAAGISHARKVAREQAEQKNLTDRVQAATLYSTPSKAPAYQNPRAALPPSQLASIGQETRKAMAGKPIALLRDEP